MTRQDRPPEIRKLDFSQFHPLDHSVLACRGYPGGRRRHLAYRWEFQVRDQVLRWVLCPFRRHRWVTWWRGQQEDGVTCARCEKERG